MDDLLWQMKWQDSMLVENAVSAEIADFWPPPDNAFPRRRAEPEQKDLCISDLGHVHTRVDVACAAIVAANTLLARFYACVGRVA